MGDNTTPNGFLSSELLELCESESLSEDGLRALIARHRLTPKNHNSLNDYEFLAEALSNERVNEGIIRYLLDYFPDAASATQRESGWTMLHNACFGPNVTLNIVRIVIDADPNSVRSVNDEGWTPLHVLCNNDKVDETTAIQILNLLMEKHPEAAQHADNRGDLPILLASGRRSPDFCRVLIEAYPGSERIADTNGLLPLNWACAHNSLSTVEYLYSLYPDAIGHSAIDGSYPIHSVIIGMKGRANPAAAVQIVQFLLNCDHDVKLRKFRGVSLLEFACWREYNDSTINAAVEIIQAIYDSHPEAIQDNEFASEIQHFCERIQAFINSQFVYARQAKNHSMMTTPDGNGQLPLHRALQNNVRLSSIQLIVKGNPSAIRTFDRGGLVPLHIACQHHDSTDVVRYLVELDTAILDTVDWDGNTALHHACRGAKYGTIAMLLEDYDAAPVSRQNNQQKLPIELLWESSAVDRDDLKYVESAFRLLKAYPETVVVKMANEQAFPQNGKKRKFGK